MTSALIRLLLAAAPLFAQLSPTDLRVEYLVDPLGVDTPHPRFSWVPRAAERGARPSGYQLVVTTAGGTAWDTGKISSDETTQIEYAGKALQSGTSYQWKVRWWDQGDRSSPYASGHFDTGLFTAAVTATPRRTGPASSAIEITFGERAGVFPRKPNPRVIAITGSFRVLSSARVP